MGVLPAGGVGGVAEVLHRPRPVAGRLEVHGQPGGLLGAQAGPGGLDRQAEQLVQPHAPRDGDLLVDHVVVHLVDEAELHWRCRRASRRRRGLEEPVATGEVVARLLGLDDVHTQHRDLGCGEFHARDGGRLRRLTGRAVEALEVKLDHRPDRLGHLRVQHGQPAGGIAGDRAGGGGARGTGGFPLHAGIVDRAGQAPPAGPFNDHALLDQVLDDVDEEQRVSVGALVEPAGQVPGRAGVGEGAARNCATAGSSRKSKVISRHSPAVSSPCTTPRSGWSGE